MSKSASRIKARSLRNEGFGIKTIAHQLKVSSSTVSLWCRDVILSEEQIRILEKRAHDPYYGRRFLNIQKQIEDRKKRTQLQIDQGIREIDNLSKRELFMAGVALYWAEGFKKDNLMGFSNLNPEMIKFFIYWLTECCEITKDRLRFRVGLNESYKDKVDEIQIYWATLLNVSLDQFQKPYFQKVLWKKIYDHPEDYHGVLRIRVSKSTDLLRKMNGWIIGLHRNIPKKLLLQNIL